MVVALRFIHIRTRLGKSEKDFSGMLFAKKDETYKILE